jgi:branched-subunit amino acid aminotransferase/4-amino-4-deoxychorismate lyase
VWLVLDGRLVTPPAPPAVAGVAREVVFDVAAEIGIEAQERPVTLFELELATEVLFSNALAGVVAARGRGGAIGRRIDNALRRGLGLTAAG